MDKFKNVDYTMLLLVYSCNDIVTSNLLPAPFITFIY